MANNTNAQAIAFCNQDIRPGCDAVVSAYLTMKRIVQVWNGQNMVALIPNDANLVQDGATTDGVAKADGRPPITDGQVNVAIANMNTLIASFEANSSIILNQFLQVSVNARSAVN